MKSTHYRFIKNDVTFLKALSQKSYNAEKTACVNLNILIIEDEKKAADYLARGLKESGFSVTVAHEGREGLFMAREYDYDLVLLDIMLPGLDGFGIIKEIRKFKSDLRVLFLTARDALDDKIKGFELGADDYLIKPFAFSELLGRIKALLRRSVQAKVEVLQLADLEINLIKRKVIRSHQVISLTAQEFNLLIFLVERQGEVLSRTRIAEAVWDINFSTDTNIVDVAIKRLRKKIDAEFESKLIHTIRGVGYVVEVR